MVSSSGLRALGRSSRYRLSRLINRGGMAEVHEAVLIGGEGFERKVALKRLLVPTEAEAFVDEARIASQLHHANIVSVFDFGVLDERPFLALELVEGIDAAELVRHAGELPAELALHVVVEIAHALEYAHHARDNQGRAMRLVHRDVTPENILISWEGDVRLTDFGIAFASRRRAEDDGVPRGKRAYMAPEQLSGGDVDGRADLFGLGCVLHALLTGRSPIDDDAPLIATPKIDPLLAPDLDGLIQRATRYAPEERYRNAGEMAAQCGVALAKRLTRDARGALREWVAGHRPQRAGSGVKRGDLIDLELVLGKEATGPLRHYRSVVVGVPALAPAGPGAAHDTHPNRPLEEAVEAVEASRIGRMLGAYRLEAVIGRGTYAEVYRAIEPSTGRSRAIKILNPTFAKNPRAAERLRREAQILSGLSHPNLVSIDAFDVAEDGVPFLVMELLEGRTLLQVLAEGSIPAARAARLAAGIARGLAVAHTAGLVHRDLKPANLMIVRGVGGEEQVKILDFGIARALFAQDAGDPPLTSPGDLIGTPLYMAPEQILRPGGAGPAADLYALGGVLFHMLGGAPPFRGTVEAVLDQQMNHAPPPLAPALGLEHLVAELLHKDPNKRLGPAEDVLRVLEALGLIPLDPVKREPDFESPRETTEVKRFIPIVFQVKQVLESRAFWIGLGLGLLPALFTWLSR